MQLINCFAIKLIYFNFFYSRHELEELKTQKGRLAEELQRKQAELSKSAASLASLRKDLEQTRGEMRQQAEAVSKLNDANAELQKTTLQVIDYFLGLTYTEKLI